MPRVTSGELRTAATGLRQFAVQLDALGTSMSTSRDAAVDTTARVTEERLWAGPRAEGTLSVIATYLDALRPVGAIATDWAARLRTLATTASTIATDMQGHEFAITERHAWVGEVPAAVQEAADRAPGALDRLSEDWESSAHAAAAILESTDLPQLSTATSAELGAFPSGEASTATLAATMVSFAEQTGLGLDVLDSTGRLQQAVEDRFYYLHNTGIGEMYFDVIETMNVTSVTDTDGDASETDVELALTDQALVEARIRAWADVHGVDLDEASVEYLTSEVMATAAAMTLNHRRAPDPETADQTSGNELVLAEAVSLAPNIGLAVVAVNRDAATSRAWWDGQPTATQTELQQTFRGSVGNLNGLPAATRDEANRAQLDADIAYYQDKLATEGLTDDEQQILTNALSVRDYLDEVARRHDATTESPPVVQLYAYHPEAFDTDGRAAIAIGDVDTADHVAVNVPGVTSHLAGLDDGKPWRLYQESRWSAWQAADGVDVETVAVIDWMGYDSPTYDDFSLVVPPIEVDGGEQTAANAEALADFAQAADMDAAHEGAELLADDIDGIRVGREGDQPHLTVIGNSYGSTTVGIAGADHHIAADEIIFSGSPGAGTAGSVDDLATGAEHTWVQAASSDLITTLGHSDGGIRLYGALGNDPAMDTFGAQRMQAENFDRGWIGNVLVEHGSYFEANSEALFNNAAVVTGNYDQMTAPADGRFQEFPIDPNLPSVELTDEFSVGIFEVDPSELDLDLRWPTPDLPFVDVDSPVEIHAWPTDPETERQPVQITHDPDGPD